ncbi:MAG: hypothetical protein LBV18_00120, partial [Alistipes sp.]|nr:hypothetical protein [Alistipes sp.]
MAQNSIHIKGARVHNLRNIEVDIPHNQLVVITGVSGSGKSTLAFDTIFAEGQRRYVESLSAYARQFLGRIDKPDVDLITGIAPAIAIEQRVNTRNPRSTVGTSTEIYDYMKLLFARIGHTFSPVSGREVRSFGVDDVVAFIESLPDNERVIVTAPLILGAGQGLIERLLELMGEGIQRVWCRGGIADVAGAVEGKAGKAGSAAVDSAGSVACSDGSAGGRVSGSAAASEAGSTGEASGSVATRGEARLIEDVLPELTDDTKPTDIDIVIDRFKVAAGSEFVARAGDSVARAFDYGNGVCRIIFGPDNEAREFSSRMEMDGIEFAEPTEHLFSFNNPLGACPKCEGYGRVTGIDEDLVVPDKTKSVYNEAIAAWRGETMGWWRQQLVDSAWKFDFPIHAPFYELSADQRRLLWTGNEHFKGLDRFFEYLESERFKIQYRVMLSRYTGKTVCPLCGGGRLRQEALWVRVGGRSISELTAMTVDDLLNFFAHLTTDVADGVDVAGEGLVVSGDGFAVPEDGFAISADGFEVSAEYQKRADALRFATPADGFAVSADDTSGAELGSGAVGERTLRSGFGAGSGSGSGSGLGVSVSAGAGSGSGSGSGAGAGSGAGSEAKSDAETLDEHDRKTGERILTEIVNRLQYLADVGL